MIGLNVEDYLTRDVAEADTAAALWEKFKQSFQARNTSRLLVLRQQLTNFRKGPKEAVIVYLARAKDLMQNLKDAGSSVTETEVVLSVLVGLPSPYTMAVEVLQMSDDISFRRLCQSCYKWSSVLDSKKKACLCQSMVQCTRI